MNAIFYLIWKSEMELKEKAFINWRWRGTWRAEARLPAAALSSNSELLTGKKFKILPKIMNISARFSVIWNWRQIEFLGNFDKLPAKGSFIYSMSIIVYRKFYMDYYYEH